MIRISVLLAAMSLCGVASAFPSCSGGAASRPPVLYFSDIQMGPATGGEGSGGAYVTLYGNNFGCPQGSSTVTIGGVAATNYPEWAIGWLFYQKITFQIPPSAATGATTITVTTSQGTSNAVPFTVNTASIYSVTTTGNDAHSGTFASPFVTMAKCVQTISPGDICYVGNGVTATSDDYSAALLLRTPGTASNFKELVAYPGATATIGTINGDRGVYPCSGLSDCPSADGGSWWTVAGFTILGGEAVYINNVHDIRMVANQLQCPTGDGESACFGTGAGVNYKALGNDVTNAGVTNASKTYHYMYFSTNSSHVEVGWNTVHDGHGCRGIQFHSTNGTNQFDLSVHDNLIYNIRCDGINFATIDASLGKVEAYNNVIYNSGIGPDPPDGAANYSCIYVPANTDTGPAGTGTVEIYNNTMYNCGTWDATYGGAVTTDTLEAVITDIRNNIIYQNNGRPYIGVGTHLSQLSGSNNVFYGSGNGPAQTTANVNANPLLANVSSADFHLQSGSPAIDTGLTITSANTYGGYSVFGGGTPRDLEGNTRPQGTTYDMGAYEYFSGASLPSGSSIGGKTAASGSLVIH